MTTPVGPVDPVPVNPAHRRTWRTLWRRCSCGLPAPCVDARAPGPDPTRPPADTRPRTEPPAEAESAASPTPSRVVRPDRALAPAKSVLPAALYVSPASRREETAPAADGAQPKDGGVAVSDAEVVAVRPFPGTSVLGTPVLGTPVLGTPVPGTPDGGVIRSPSPAYRHGASSEQPVVATIPSPPDRDHPSWPARQTRSSPSPVRQADAMLRPVRQAVTATASRAPVTAPWRKAEPRRQVFDSPTFGALVGRAGHLTPAQAHRSSPGNRRLALASHDQREARAVPRQRVAGDGS